MFLTVLFLGVVNVAILVIPGFLTARKKSRNPYLWAVLGVLLPIVSVFIIYRLHPGTYGWLSRSEYSAKYPLCRMGKGFSCFHCGSQSIRGWGRRGLATLVASSIVITVAKAYSILNSKESHSYFIK